MGSGPTRSDHDQQPCRCRSGRPNAVTANVHLSWVNPTTVSRATVVGHGAMAVLDDHAVNRLTLHDKAVVAGDTAESGPELIEYRDGDVVMPHIGGADASSVLFEHFVGAVQGHHRAGLNPTSALDVLRVLDAADISLRTGPESSWLGRRYSPASGELPGVDHWPLLAAAWRWFRRRRKTHHQPFAT
ncbi:MAG: hypothetical protein ACI8Y4_003421 [Candidatus Poriferisodalaceae bacterium]|jgi:hypothetical protein